MSLDAPLSNNKQNLIFARNGTGKSFLARSLRLLDESSLEGVAYVFSYEEGGVIGGQSSLYKDEVQMKLHTRTVRKELRTNFLRLREGRVGRD